MDDEKEKQEAPAESNSSAAPAVDTGDELKKALDRISKLENELKEAKALASSGSKPEQEITDFDKIFREEA